MVFMALTTILRPKEFFPYTSFPPFLIRLVPLRSNLLYEGFKNKHIGQVSQLQIFPEAIPSAGIRARKPFLSQFFFPVLQTDSKKPQFVTSVKYFCHQSANAWWEFLLGHKSSTNDWAYEQRWPPSAGLNNTIIFIFVTKKANVQIAFKISKYVF